MSAAAPIADRFWQKVDKQGPPADAYGLEGRCFLWRGATIDGTRGVIKLDAPVRRNAPAHWVAFFLANGRWPETKHLLWRCRNRACVNSAHLFEGSLSEARDRVSREDRFWRRVNKNGPVPAHRPELGPCWVLGGNRRYGRVSVGGRGEGGERAHRFSFFLAHGRWPIPNANHHCDNPPCVNPAHLFEGTQRDNVKDMMSKRRQRFGGRDL